MSFPRYPKYKPSGVEWLGEVPVGWEVKPLRSVFKFSKGLTITKESLQDEGVNCVNYGEIHSKYGFRLNPAIHPLRCVSLEYLSTNPEALIRNGDFVFADTSEDLEGSGNFTHLRSDDPIFAGYHTIIAHPRKNTCSLLLAYQIHSSIFRSQIQSQVKGVKVFSISQGILKAAKCWLPPLAEQTAIAEFLDRETGKIDGLVAEQRRLMELLKEKRQAVISHAVTKGLNPHAPMKPSGIEWLGDVPVGWEVFPLNRLVQAGRRITYGIVQPGPRDESGRFMVRGQDYSFGWAEPETLFRVSDEVEIPYRRARLIEGDLVITIVGAGVGNVAVVPPWLDGANITQTTARISVDPAKADPRFVSAVLKGPIGRRSVELYAKGAAQPGLNLEHVRIFPITVPPLSEQREIADYIEAETSKFDTLTAEAQRAIDLLQERRTALISAAVTGQIDVRQHPKN